MQFFSRKSLPSIRTKTSKLVLACVLPSILGVAALTYDFYQRARLDLLRDAERSAQALMLAVDRDLQNGETAAQVLASSPSLDNANLAAFHAQARSVLRPGLPVYAFVLSRGDGRPLLHTALPYDSVLPPNGNAENIRQVFRSGQTRTSDLFQNGPGQAYLLSIDVPVQREGALAYVLSVQFETAHLVKLIAEQRLPAGWTGQIYDSGHFIVARNLGQDRVVGQRARAAMIARLERDDHGILELNSREGVPVYAVFSRSAARGWAVTIGVPLAATRAQLFDTLFNILAGVAALLVFGFVTAWIIGGRIGRSVRALCGPAAALGRGQPLAMPPVRIREVAEVGAALQQVEAELLRYRSGLESLVTERTEQLNRSKSLLDTVFASAPIGLCFLDHELRFVMVNDYLARNNGKTVAEHIGRTLPELLGPIGAQFEKIYRKVIATGQPIIDLEGSGALPAEPDATRHWNVSYYPVFGHDGELVGVTGFVLDITERKRQQQRIRDNEAQFRALYEMSADAHMLATREAGFIGGNQAAAAMFGCANIDEFLKLSPATTSPEFQPDGRRSADMAQEHMRLTLETGSQHFEWLHQRPDGNLFHADVLLTSVDIGDKRIILATVRDISERIAAETALRATSAQLEQSERFIRTVTDNLPGMVGYWDAELRCRFANRRYLYFFGRTQEEMLGHTMQELMYDEQLARNVPYVVAVLGGKPQNFEREVESGGELRQTWANYIPDFDERGGVRGFYVLISDISELKRTEQRLQELNEQLVQALDRAEMANSAKSEFLANMSHEIRTPMHAIMGLARLLEEAPLERRERSYVAKMKMATQSLLGIINDVLDFSKIEAGQLELESTGFRLDQVLSSVSVLAASSAWQKGVEPVFSVGPGVPQQLVGDPMRLQQVLLNLIGNAIKFTEQGEVLLSVRMLEQDGATVRLEFAVLDSGIGISPEQQRSMFDAFSQGDSSTSRKYGGTGLGLAISRRLVQLMGGSIGVTSELGQGSEFRFDTRFGVGDAAPALALPDLPGLQGLSVLVVDDNASARTMLVAACAAFGWRVESAANGAAALELLRAARRDDCNFDLMFLDGAMPGLDGVAVLTYARAEPAIVLPRVALMVDDQARERLLTLADDIQFDAILCKPFTPGALAETIAQLRADRPHDTGGLTMPAALAGRLRGLHILLVEDNPINQEVANYLLLYAGATVDIAANGRIAVSMLAETPARFDAVLMDIQMPVMNGYEASEAIRAMGLALPIVAMTANAMHDDRQHAIDAGMNAHLAKPIDVDDLVATLNRLTEGGAAREQQARSAPASSAAGAETPLPTAVAGIDLKATLPRFGGNFANFAALFKRFESSQGGTLDEVRTALRGADRPAAKQLVHRLRGVAANLGATQVESLALEFEQALRSAGDAELLMRLAELDGAMATVLEAARELRLPLAGEEGPAQAILHPDLDGALAQLLTLLQNNNMKALAQFEQLRAALAPRLAPAEAAALADAIETLSFAQAAALVQDLLN